MSRRLSGGNDANCAAMLGVCGDEQAVPMGDTKSQPTFLADRMVRIWERNCQRIAEHGSGFLEGYAVLGEIGERLGIVPLE